MCLRKSRPEHQFTHISAQNWTAHQWRTFSSLQNVTKIDLKIHSAADFCWNVLFKFQLVVHDSIKGRKQRAIQSKRGCVSWLVVIIYIILLITVVYLEVSQDLLIVIHCRVSVWQEKLKGSKLVKDTDDVFLFGWHLFLISPAHIPIAFAACLMNVNKFQYNKGNIRSTWVYFNTESLQKLWFVLPPALLALTKGAALPKNCLRCSFEVWPVSLKAHSQLEKSLFKGPRKREAWELPPVWASPFVAAELKSIVVDCNRRRKDVPPKFKTLSNVFGVADMIGDGFCFF